MVELKSSGFEEMVSWRKHFLLLETHTAKHVTWNIILFIFMTEPDIKLAEKKEREGFEPSEDRLMNDYHN